MNTKLFKILNNFLSWLIIILMGSMTAIVIISVFLRYVFSITFIWSEELVSMIFITLCYYGCVVAVKEREHIGVDFVIDALPFTGKKIAKTISALLIIVVQAVIIKYSIGWISTAGAPPSPGLRLSLGVFYAAMPISSALIILYEILEIANIIKEKKVTQ